MSQFTISQHNETISVTQEAKDSFIVEMPDKTLYLIVRQDNEGANHWFEEGSDNETEETKSIGIAIETALAESGATH
ncbi:hypothetical protein MKQ68_09575 [Chitinophaga horti]|uniref:Uncharacterized protein n=1 Tax=Chitinophaga horti TaxID=2920382 RepID=A0ABY6J6Q1_9BACT|nr:hypothetical protein [Chitinophaga horti]UYQ95346.1 hypothetical protein MKQ68_09575 [Chitinophaga horti]